MKFREDKDIHKDMNNSINKCVSEDINRRADSTEQRSSSCMVYPAINPVETGAYLKRLTQQRGYAVKDIQSLLHLSCPQPVYRWFRGQVLPSVDHLYVLSRLLCVHMEELLFPTGVHPAFSVRKGEDDGIKGWEDTGMEWRNTGQKGMCWRNINRREARWKCRVWRGRKFRLLAAYWQAFQQRIV